MEGNKVRRILSEHKINFTWLAGKLGISGQALNSRLNAQDFKDTYLIQISEIIGKDIFGLKSHTTSQPILNLDVRMKNEADFTEDNYPVLEYVSIYAFNGCTGVTVYGNEAAPKYNSGDVVFFLPSDKDIIAGCTYLIVTKTERLIRKCFPDSRTIRLEPFSPVYPTRNIRKQDILHAYKIVGTISREQM